MFESRRRHHTFKHLALAFDLYAYDLARRGNIEGNKIQISKIGCPARNKGAPDGLRHHRPAPLFLLLAHHSPRGGELALKRSTSRSILPIVWSISRSIPPCRSNSTSTCCIISWSVSRVTLPMARTPLDWRVAALGYARSKG